MKKRSKLPFIILVLLLIATNAGNYWYFNIYQVKDYKTQKDSLEKELAALDTTVYVPTEDIAVGTTITEGLLVQETRKLGNQKGLFTAADIGSTAVNFIPKGTTMMSSFVYDAEVDTNNLCEFDYVNLPSNLLPGSFVDVRIHYPNGEEYIVVAKAPVVAVLSDFDVQLKLSEKEQQYMASAETDRSRFDAQIRATVYMETQAEKAHDVTYAPSSDTLDILCNEKLITTSEYSTLLNKRNALERGFMLPTSLIGE